MWIAAALALVLLGIVLNIAYGWAAGVLPLVVGVIWLALAVWLRVAPLRKRRSPRRGSAG